MFVTDCMLAQEQMPLLGTTVAGHAISLVMCVRYLLGSKKRTALLNLQLPRSAQKVSVHGFHTSLECVKGIIDVVSVQKVRLVENPSSWRLWYVNFYLKNEKQRLHLITRQ